MKSSPKSIFMQFLIMAAAVFILLMLVLICSRAQEWMRTGEEAASLAFHDMEGAISYLKKQDFEKADFLFQSAEEVFAEAERKLLVPPRQGIKWEGAYTRTPQQLLETGISIARLGQQATGFISSARRIPKEFISRNLPGDSGSEVTDLIKEETAKLKAIQREVDSIEKDLKTISREILPAEWQEKWTQGVESLELISNILRALNMASGSVLKLLGDPLPHRFLVLFQNRYEVRATGGFIGSYAIVDVSGGKIKKIDFKDVYELDGQLRDVIPAPPGISALTKRYFLRDANYSPDFPTSAKKIMWFLEHSRGPSVDTVIAIDQAVIEELLRITGPVPLGKWGMKLDADNFSATLSYLIESKLISEDSPKQVMAGLIPVLKEEILKNKNYEALLSTLSSLIRSGHLQAYSEDPGIEKLWETLNMDGRFMAPIPKTDFLAIVDTSIGGNKSDRFIKTSLLHTTQITKNGVLTDQLVINRGHTWSKNDIKPIDALWKKFGSGKLDRGTILDILGRGDNVDFMRVYLPKGSRIDNIQGVAPEKIRAYEDLGYTVFSFQWPSLAAGKSVQAVLSYQLPFALSLPEKDNYSFVLRKQAGVESQSLQKVVELEEGIRSTDQYPKPAAQSESRVAYKTVLEDNWFSVTALEQAD